MLFAEMEGFSRLHVHVVPPDMPISRSSTADQPSSPTWACPEVQQMPEADRNILAARLRETLVP
jgi:hypothetical protein